MCVLVKFSLCSPHLSTLAGFLCMRKKKKWQGKSNSKFEGGQVKTKTVSLICKPTIEKLRSDNQRPRVYKHFKRKKER